MLTPGQAHDLTCAPPLLEEADPEALIGDKAYDADPLLETLAQRNITPVIPPKANRKTARPCDFARYCERNLVERFFCAMSLRKIWLRNIPDAPRSARASRVCLFRG